MEISVCASEFAQKAAVRNRNIIMLTVLLCHILSYISRQLRLYWISLATGQSRYREENRTTNTSIPRAVGAEAALWKPSNLY